MFCQRPVHCRNRRGFSAKAKEVAVPIDEGKFILELVDMRSSLTMAQELRTDGPARFGLMSTHISSLTSRKLQSSCLACLAPHTRVNQASHT